MSSIMKEIANEISTISHKGIQFEYFWFYVNSCFQTDVQTILQPEVIDRKIFTAQFFT